MNTIRNLTTAFGRTLPALFATASTESSVRPKRRGKRLLLGPWMVLVAAVVVCASVSIGIAETLDQSQTDVSGTLTMCNTDGSKWIASQSFKIDGSHITRIEVYIKSKHQESTGVPVTLELRTSKDSGLIADDSLTYSEVEENSWNSFDINCDVTPGATYWYRFRIWSGATTYYQMALATDNPYPDGEGWAYDGEWSQPSGWDWSFRIYTEEPTATYTIRVKDTTPFQNPLSGVTVEPQTWTASYQVTDTNGEVVLYNVPYGNQTVKCSMTGYTTEYVIHLIDDPIELLDHVPLNQPPVTPVLNAPADGAGGQSATPELQLTGTDPEGTRLKYEILLATNSAFTGTVQSFDQTDASPLPGWSATNYASGVQATYTIQNSLTPGVTYFWKARSRDYQYGADDWSDWTGTQSFTVASTVPATYYVGDCYLCDPPSNTNDGSEFSPWATIGHALSQVANGDTIIVREGAPTYDDEPWGLEVTKSVTLRGQGDVLLDGYGEDYPTFIVTAPNVTIEGFTMFNGWEGIVIEPGATNAYIADNTIYDMLGPGIRVEADSAEIVGNTIYDCQGNGVHVSADEVDVEDNIVYGNNQGIHCASGADNCHIRNNSLSGNTQSAQDDGSNNDWDSNYYEEYGSSPGPDLDADGYGDDAYTIPGTAIAQDVSPRMAPIRITQSGVSKVCNGCLLLGEGFGLQEVHVLDVALDLASAHLEYSWSWEATVPPYAHQDVFAIWDRVVTNCPPYNTNESCAVELVGASKEDVGDVIYYAHLNLHHHYGMYVGISAKDAAGDPVPYALVDLDYDTGSGWSEYSIPDLSIIEVGSKEATAPAFDGDGNNVKMNEYGYARVRLPLIGYSGSGISAGTEVTAWRIRVGKDGVSDQWMTPIAPSTDFAYAEDGELGHYRCVFTLEPPPRGDVWWSASEYGNEISGAHDGDVVYMCVESAPPSTPITFKVWEAEVGQDDGPFKTITVTTDGSGKACATWTARYIDDGWPRIVHGDPEFVIKATGEGFYEESGELQVYDEDRNFIDLARWSANPDGSGTITEADPGETVYLHVETRGLVPGEFVSFSIDEKDTAFGVWEYWSKHVDDVQAQVQADGSCTAPWLVQYVGDVRDLECEMKFKASAAGVSKSSGVLEVSPEYATFIDVGDATGLSAGGTNVVELTAFLWKHREVAGVIIPGQKDGLGSRTVDFYIEINGVWQHIGSDQTSEAALYGDGHASVPYTVPETLNGNYRIKVTFSGAPADDLLSSEGYGMLTVRADAYAAEILDVFPLGIEAGRENIVRVVFKNTGNNIMSRVEMRVEGAMPAGWSIGRDSKYGCYMMSFNVAPDQVVTNGFYITAPAEGGQVDLTWKLSLATGLLAQNRIPLCERTTTITTEGLLRAPELISPESGSVTQDTVTLEWEDLGDDPENGENADKYEVNIYERYPHGWTVVTGGDAQGGWDESESHSGNKSLKSRIPADGSANFVYWRAEEAMDMEGFSETKCTLSAWIKTLNYSPATADRAYIKFQVFSDPAAGNLQIEDKIAYIDASPGAWTRLVKSFDWPCWGVSIQNLSIRFEGEQGTLWVDDIAIVEGDSAALPQSRPMVKLTGPSSPCGRENVTFSWTGSDPDEDLKDYAYALLSPGDSAAPSWSDWGTGTTKTYADVGNYGRFTFFVKARDEGNRESRVESWDFHVVKTASDNLLPNPGFETDTGGVVDHWVCTAEGNSDGAWTDEKRRSGDKSLKLRAIDGAVEWKAQTYFTENVVSVDAGAYYRLSAWLRRNESVEGMFYMRVEFDSGDIITLSLPDGPGNWTEYRKAFEMPAAATKIASVTLKAEDGFGVVYFDDVSLVKIQDAGDDYEVMDAPQTWISGKEDGHVFSMDEEITYGWVGQDPNGQVVGFEWSLNMPLNDSDWFVFTTDDEKTFEHLEAGSYTFYVAAVDDSGYRDRSPMAARFVVDTPPNVSIDSGPWGQVGYSDVTFTWSAVDDDGDLDAAPYSYRLVGEASDTGWSDWTDLETVVYTGLYGRYDFYVRARDEHGVEDPTPAERYFVVNTIPVIASVSHTPGTTICMAQGASQTFSAQAEDDDVLTYEWTIDGEVVSQSSTFTYEPTYNESGTKTVVLSVSDGSSVTNATWSVNVYDRNGPPEIMSYQPDETDVSVVAGSALVFSAVGYDPDGDVLTYEWMLDGTPVGSNPSWTCLPGEPDVGPHTVQITVTDPSSAADTHSWSVEVTSNVVGDLKLTPIGDKFVNEAELLTFKVTATGTGSYTISVANLPLGATLIRMGDVTEDGTVDTVDVVYLMQHAVNPAGYPLNLLVGDMDCSGSIDSLDAKMLNDYLSGTSIAGMDNKVFSWTPGYMQDGVYPNVHFEVTDGVVTNSEDITITVCNAPIDTAGTYTMTLDSGDPGTKWHTLSWSGTEDGVVTDIKARLRTAAMEAALATASWSDYYGEDNIEQSFTISPPDNRWIEVEVILETVNPDQTPVLEDLMVAYHVPSPENKPPVLGAIGNKSVNEGSTLTFTVSATDADGDSLTYSAAICRRARALMLGPEHSVGRRLTVRREPTTMCILR